MSEGIVSKHVEDPRTGVHRTDGDPDRLTYMCIACCEDWPCDVVTLAKAARAVLDYDPKERWGGPHDWLAELIGYYGEGTEGEP
jgi:hypothetical protein